MAEAVGVLTGNGNGIGLLAKERTIAADDANQDPRTKCFSASYLMPLNIGAMLDVPVWTTR